MSDTVSTEERIIRRWFEEGWNQRNAAVFQELIAPGAVGHMPHTDVEGPQGFLGLMREFVSAFPDLHIVLEEILSAPGRVVVRWRITGTHDGEGFGLPASGLSVDQWGTSWYDVEDGRLTEAWYTWNQGTFFMELHQAGTMRAQAAASS